MEIDLDFSDLSPDQKLIAARQLTRIAQRLRAEARAKRQASRPWIDAALPVHDLPPADVGLEPELLELCSGMRAGDRAKTAEKFMRWVNQLTQSVGVLDPDLVPLVEPPQVPRGFFLLNLANWQQNQLRRLARECKVPLRSVLNWGIAHAQTMLESKIKVARLLGVAPSKCWTLTTGDERN